VTKAALVDILEREKEQVDLVQSHSRASSKIRLAFRGFQVVSVKLWLGEDG
jgi:hypothetical protein